MRLDDFIAALQTMEKLHGGQVEVQMADGAPVMRPRPDHYKENANVLYLTDED